MVSWHQQYLVGSSSESWHSLLHLLRQTINLKTWNIQLGQRMQKHYSVSGPEQKRPKELQDLVNSAHFKSALLQFLADAWQKPIYVDQIHEDQLYVGLGLWHTWWCYNQTWCIITSQPSWCSNALPCLQSCSHRQWWHSHFLQKGMVKQNKYSSPWVICVYSVRQAKHGIRQWNLENMVIVKENTLGFISLKGTSSTCKQLISIF